MTAGCAWATEVVSSNVVGYNKITLQPGLNLIGTGFAKVGGSNYALKDLFQGTDVALATAGSGADNGDLIQLFDPAVGGYATQYFFYTSNGEYGETYDDKWYLTTADEEPTDDTIDARNGFWYNYRGSSAIQLTTAGEVSTNDVVVTIQPGLNLITYPFPADFDFTKLDWKTAGATAGSGADNGDLIQVFDPDPSVKGYATQYFFYTSNGEYGETYDDKWYLTTADEEPTTAKIPAGKGFWYNHRGSSSFTITFPSPL